MNLYRSESSNPKWNAQRNLSGRTNYVDEDTLRWHKSRVLSARHVDGGLLFAIVTSDALDMNNTRRGFRYVIFDVFGTVIGRVDLERAFRSHESAAKAMWKALEAIDARKHTLEAIEAQRAAYGAELDGLVKTVQALPVAQKAA